MYNSLALMSFAVQLFLTVGSFVLAGFTKYIVRYEEWRGRAVVRFNNNSRVLLVLVGVGSTLLLIADAMILMLGPQKLQLLIVLGMMLTAFFLWWAYDHVMTDRSAH